MTVVEDLHLRWMRREAARHYMDRRAQQTGAREFTIDLSMGCADPITRDAFVAGSDGSMTLIRKLRCRKCAVCLRHKSRYWTARAIAEYATAQCTWFGTLTLAPASHFELDARLELPRYIRARQLDGTFAEKQRSGRNLAEMSPDGLFNARCAELASDVARWIKLVRWHTGAPLRYLLVFERHSGEKNDWMTNRPHVHILLHEKYAGTVVPLSEYYPKGNKVYMQDSTLVRSKWSYGFTKFELVTSWRACAYAVKYMRKAPQGRVRASLRYGSVDWTADIPQNELARVGYPKRDALTTTVKSLSSPNAPGEPGTALKKVTTDTATAESDSAAEIAD